jgi:quinol monooxygenase YgiN
MIIIIAKSIVKDGKKEEFKRVAEELIIESRKEKGCISYSLYEELKNNNVMAFIEEWKDEKAIENHNNSEHFKRIVPELAKLREGNAELSLYKKIKEL